jgi:hypothetical protein
MAIKAGQILHDASGFVVDRIQTGGVSNLNIPEEKIYELGNYETVATVRDIADLSFEVESLDVSTEIEALILGKDPTATVDGDAFDFTEALPLDITSPFKASGGLFTIVKGINVPNLTLETAAYRFGLRQNSTETFTFRGDTIHYIPGTPRQEVFTLVNNTLTYNFANTALVYNESGDAYYALSACVKNESTNAYKRLFLGSEYTNTSAGITTLSDYFDEGYTHLHVTYGTATVDTYDETVHEGVGIKPAAIRGKDIKIWVTNPTLATPALELWSGVQSFEVTRQVNLENEEEFGNYHFVAQTYDTADVTGSIAVRPADDEDLFDKIRQVANISNVNEIIGPYTSAPLEVEVRIYNPDDAGNVIKTLYIEDARFLIPNVQGQVQQKLQVTFNFTSDGGHLVVYAGERP